LTRTPDCCTVLWCKYDVTGLDQVELRLGAILEHVEVARLVLQGVKSVVPRQVVERVAVSRFRKYIPSGVVLKPG
jgi:hypothetical protein